MTDNADALRLAQRMRGVHSPCGRCDGLGWRPYSSGSTWRGGMGTASTAYDVCDTCWGSGDTKRHGVDLRVLEAARADWEEDQAMQWLGRALGANLRTVRARMADLADLCEAQARRRKLPAGVDAFWWGRNWEGFAAVLRRLGGES